MGRSQRQSGRPEMGQGPQDLGEGGGPRRKGLRVEGESSGVFLKFCRAEQQP